MVKRNKQTGLTLIEVLVVAAIIAMLATIIVTSMGLVRSKGRDARRMADIRQINSAIQFYINDNGHAPFVGAYNCDVDITTASSPNCDYIGQYNAAAWALFAADLAPYLPNMPTDPLSTSTNQYGYLPPLVENFYCNSSCNGGDNTDYAIFVYRTENQSSVLNLFVDGILTFGFGSSSSYNLGD